MKHLLFIYHSQSGHTEALIEKCKAGAAKEEVEIRVVKALHAILEDMIWADGILLGTPENFGSMSGGLKNFFDRTYYPAREIGINKPYALLISCETDGSGTEQQIQ
ncbi:MAG TPA: flavodoxin family protein, partial [Chitinophagales bacterium]|nr:flavodoxin family protein [Chitinophagales bacterium]